MIKLIFISLLVGCVNEDNFVEKISKAECFYMKDCAEANFWASYDDMDDCLDEVQDGWDNLLDVYGLGDCDFDEEEAQNCLDAYNSSCKEAGQDDDHFEDCWEVYDCF